MSEPAKRITLTYDIEDRGLTDEEAIERAREAASSEVLHWHIQDLPELGLGRWKQL